MCSRPAFGQLNTSEADFLPVTDVPCMYYVVQWIHEAKLQSIKAYQVPASHLSILLLLGPLLFRENIAVRDWQPRSNGGTFFIQTFPIRIVSYVWSFLIIVVTFVFETLP